MSSISSAASSILTAPTEVVSENEICQFDRLPVELLDYLFSDSEMTCRDLADIVQLGWKKMAQDKTEGKAVERPLWQIVAHDVARKKIYEQHAFGSEKWREHFGVDVEKSTVVSLPLGIEQILSQPFSATQTVSDACMLMWMPQGMTINRIGHLVQPKLPETETGYRYMSDRTVQRYGETPIEQSYWVVLTTGVLDDSRDKSFAEQTALVERLAARTQLTYEVPRALEVIACVFAKYLSSSTRIFSNNPSTYTYCAESVDHSQVVIGGLSPSGLCVCFFYYDNDCLGVAAALRKF